MPGAEAKPPRTAVWGLGREGRAALRMLRRDDPALPLVVFDEAPDTALPDELGDGVELIRGADRIGEALDRVDEIVKSPGVSLYHPLIGAARERGIRVTSLLNLWFAEHQGLTTVCVTGSKGKSTTASLIAHILGRLGHRVALVGNIGVPITETDAAAADCAVIEVSSYQAADFAGLCDIAVLTSLFPEHLDWHGSLDNYYRDKLNLLRHCRHAVVDRAAAATVERIVGERPAVLFPDDESIHWRGVRMFDRGAVIGAVANAHLARPHNLANLCAALNVTRLLGADPRDGLAVAEDFCGLPHRQQELGERDGMLFVDDSISTTPQSTLAALAVYAGRPVTVILGGYDRGVDYGGLVAALNAGAARAAICLGDSGPRIHRAIQAGVASGQQPRCAAFLAASMQEAVASARQLTPAGGVVLLSPAAPSYGPYHDFAERGRDFAAKAGFA